jgi:hypothetical protein
LGLVPSAVSRVHHPIRSCIATPARKEHSTTTTDVQGMLGLQPSGEHRVTWDPYYVLQAECIPPRLDNTCPNALPLSLVCIPSLLVLTQALGIPPWVSHDRAGYPSMISSQLTLHRSLHVLLSTSPRPCTFSSPQTFHQCSAPTREHSQTPRSNFSQYQLDAPAPKSQSQFQPWPVTVRLDMPIQGSAANK